MDTKQFIWFRIDLVSSLFKGFGREEIIGWSGLLRGTNADLSQMDDFETAVFRPGWATFSTGVKTLKLKLFSGK